MQRPYTQPQDFNDLPQDLHFVWKSSYVLKNSSVSSFADPHTLQLLTLDCIKTVLTQGIQSSNELLSDFCLNLTCRLCLRKFKKLKLDPALLAYVTYVAGKVQGSSAQVHSSISETKLLGHFPIPTETTITQCLNYYDSRPRIVTRLPNNFTHSLQLHQDPAGPNSLGRVQQGPGRVAPGFDHRQFGGSDKVLLPPGYYVPQQTHTPHTSSWPVFSPVTLSVNNSTTTFWSARPPVPSAHCSHARSPTTTVVPHTPWFSENPTSEGTQSPTTGDCSSDDEGDIPPPPPGTPPPHVWPNYLPHSSTFSLSSLTQRTKQHKHLGDHVTDDDDDFLPLPNTPPIPPTQSRSPALPPPFSLPPSFRPACSPPCSTGRTSLKRQRGGDSA